MKPTEQMGSREAACFVNLKKAMNDCYIVKDYLENARHLAPNNEIDGHISSAIRECNEVMSDVQYAVQSLTN